VGINSEPVEHGLQLVMDIGQQREVISKQQFRDSKIWNTSKCALYPFSQTVRRSIIQVDGEKQGGEGTALLASHQTLAAHLLACPHPAVCIHLCNTSLRGWRVSEQCETREEYLLYIICVIQVLEDGEYASVVNQGRSICCNTTEL